MPAAARISESQFVEALTEGEEIDRFDTGSTVIINMIVESKKETFIQSGEEYFRVQ